MLLSSVLGQAWLAICSLEVAYLFPLDFDNFLSIITEITTSLSMLHAIQRYILSFVLLVIIGRRCIVVENRILQILSSFEIFKGLTEDDFKKIQANCQQLKFKESDILMQEGQINSALYIIVQGRAEVCLPEQNGEIKYKRPTKVKLDIENEGDFFGEYSLLDSKPASASVIATQDGELIKITKHNLDNILKNNDRIAKTVYRNILKRLVERLRHINKEYDEIYLL